MNEAYPEGTFCEIRRHTIKRQKLNPGTKRTYTPQFQDMISKAKTVGDIVRAYHKAGSTYGIHSDVSPEDFAKIEAAKKCKEAV